MYRILQTGMTTNYGGVETVVMNWYRYINRDKIQFDFLVSHKSPLIAYEDEIKKLGGHIYRSYYGRKEKPFTARKYIEEIFSNDTNIMGVHMNLNTLEYITPLLVAEKKGLPVKIAHSHTAGKLNKKQHPETRLMQILNKQLLQSSKFTKLGCSMAACKYLFGNGQGAVIHNALELKSYKYNEETRKKIRERYSLSDDTIVIGFVGRMQYYKNPEFIIKIFNEYNKINRDSVLVLIGEGPLEDYCRKLVQDMGINKKVLFLGMQRETAKFYSMFDMFLFPSLFEGLGVVLIEAQMSGLPCLVSDVIPEDVMLTSLIEKHDLSDNEKKWAEHLNRLIIKYKKKRSIIDCSRELSNAGYDISKEAKQLENLYLSMIEGR